MDVLVKHKGVWKDAKYLRQYGKVIEDGEVRPAKGRDLQEGKCIIIGTNIWTVFLKDHVQMRYFLELAFTAQTKGEMVKAYNLLSKECF